MITKEIECILNERTNVSNTLSNIKKINDGSLDSVVQTLEERVKRYDLEVNKALDKCDVSLEDVNKFLSEQVNFCTRQLKQNNIIDMNGLYVEQLLIFKRLKEIVCAFECLTTPFRTEEPITAAYVDPDSLDDEWLSDDEDEEDEDEYDEDDAEDDEEIEETDPDED